MAYPEKILPNTDLKSFSCNLNDKIIVRHFTLIPPDDILDPTTNKILEKHICSPREHIIDLSTNLFGIFDIECLKIELTSEGRDLYNEYCTPDSKVDIPSEQHYQLNPNRSFWWLILDKIHNEEISFKHNEKSYKAKCIATHTPMKWNFWHFSLRWEIEGIGFLHEMTDEKLQKKIANKLGHEARVFIKMFAETSKLDAKEIDPSCYKK